MLVAIALVAGVLLGALNYLTYVDPDAAIAAEVAGIYGIGSDKVTSDASLAVDSSATAGEVLRAAWRTMCPARVRTAARWSWSCA